MEVRASAGKILLRIDDDVAASTGLQPRGHTCNAEQPSILWPQQLLLPWLTCLVDLLQLQDMLSDGASWKHVQAELLCMHA